MMGRLGSGARSAIAVATILIAGAGGIGVKSSPGPGAPAACWPATAGFVGAGARGPSTPAGQPPPRRAPCLVLRGGGRGGGGAGGLWRDMPAPRPVGARRVAKKVAAASSVPPPPQSATGALGYPVQRAPGFENDASEEDGEGEESANPRVLARRRRNRERRQRLVQSKREREAQLRQEALQHAILGLQPGAAILAHFKSKSGQSKHPAILNVTGVHVAEAEVSVRTASGRAQTLPFSWIRAVRNCSAETGPHAGEGQSLDGVRLDSGGDAGTAGSEGKEGEKKGKWLAEEKLKQILHRRRARARLRRRERHKRKTAEVRAQREQEAAVRAEEEAVREEERRRMEREAKQRRGELHTQHLFNSTDVFLAEAYSKNIEIADRLYQSGFVRDVSARDLAKTERKLRGSHDDETDSDESVEQPGESREGGPRGGDDELKESSSSDSFYQVYVPAYWNSFYQVYGFRV
jgi:hypothetical protein